MGGYSFSFSGILVNSTVARALCEIKTTATDYPRIKEISGAFFNVSTAASVIGIGMPAVGGVVKSGYTPTPFLAYDPNNNVPSPIQVITDWATPPTAPTKFYKRMSLNNTTTTNIQWDFVFRSGITIAPNSSMVLWLISSTAANATSQLFEINIELDT